jgi:hypothetical protein
MPLQQSRPALPRWLIMAAAVAAAASLGGGGPAGPLPAHRASPGRLVADEGRGERASPRLPQSALVPLVQPHRPPALALRQRPGGGRAGAANGSAS